MWFSISERRKQIWEFLTFWMMIRIREEIKRAVSRKSAVIREVGVLQKEGWQLQIKQLELVWHGKAVRPLTDAYNSELKQTEPKGSVCFVIE
jgi:hypothetical protein